MRNRKWIFGAVLGLVLFSSGCSLEKPTNTMGLKIILEDQQAQSFNLFSDPSILADPTSNSDFNCFTVNVTGPGVPSNVQAFGGCSSGDNFHGRGQGLMAKPVPRNSSIELDLPAGSARTIDVYGIYPPLSECGGSDNSSSAGYYLGGVTRDLLTSTSVAIGINYTSAAIPGKVTCSGDHSTNYKTYVFAAGASNIKSMSFDPDSGVMVDVNSASLATVSRIHASASGNYLFASDGTSSVNIYSITSATGDLTSVGTAGWGAAISNFVGTRNDNLLFGISGSTIYPVSINGATGAVTTRAASSVTPTIMTMAVTSTGYAYITSSPSTSNKYVYDVSTGHVGSEAGSGDTQHFDHMKTDPQDRFLYGVTSSGSVVGYAINSGNGAITTITGSPWSTTTGVTDLEINPAGTYLYVLIGGGSSVYGFSIDQTTGALTALTGSPFNIGGTTLGDMVIEPSGKYLLAIASGSNEIRRVPINTDGTLGSSTSFPVGTTNTYITATRVAQ